MLDLPSPRSFRVHVSGIAGSAGPLVRMGFFALFAVAGLALADALLTLLAATPGWARSAVALSYIGLLAYAWWLVMAPTRVIVGADGMRLVRHGKSRFFPIAAMLGTHRSANTVSVFLDEALVGARQIAFTSRRPGYRSPLTYDLIEDPEIVDLASCLRDRIGEVSGGRPHELPGRLARSGRPVGAWVAALRELGVEQSYRTAPVSREELWRVVEDATTPAALRVAAAVALRPSVDAERVRLRVQADTSVAQGFRGAIEAVLDNEGEIETRLGLLDEERR